MDFVGTCKVCIFTVVNKIEYTLCYLFKAFLVRIPVNKFNDFCPRIRLERNVFCRSVGSSDDKRIADIGLFTHDYYVSCIPVMV